MGLFLYSDFFCDRPLSFQNLTEVKIELPIESYLTYDDILRQRQTFVAAQKAYFDERFGYVMAGESLRKAIGRMENEPPPGEKSPHSLKNP